MKRKKGEDVLLGIVLLENGCWEHVNKPRVLGYVQVGVDGRYLMVHNVVYKTLRGPVPFGLELDHLCRNRACCNPDHLEPVTRRENLHRGNPRFKQNAAKTHCPRGHAYDEVNTRLRNGSRACRTCDAKRAREYRRRVK